MLDWHKIILEKDDTMKTAIEILNSESLRIVMVVDDEKHLIGTVTDGDIRRALLKHMTLSTPISQFMKMDPTVAIKGESKEEILAKMKTLDILQIPIVDSERRVVGLETIQRLYKRRTFDNPVFIMAGGFGRRLRPLTDDVPKPMLKIGNKPILETILDQFIESGFHNFFISTHYKAEMVHEYFGDGSTRNVTIQYVYEKEPLGTAGALGLLPKKLPNLPILMMNGDLLTKIDFKELLNFHNEQGGDATICVRKYDFQVPYGVIESRDNRITKIVEKPVHKFFVNAGIYALNSAIIEKLDGITYIDMPHLLESRIETGGQVNMFPLHEYWMDIGEKGQFIQAQEDSIRLFQ
ncbi:MAG: nucleotidyltransferase family protein [Desulfamplus sp.]|nr:nucleotidyltransferase family protein [Desulfamplus sp.]